MKKFFVFFVLLISTNCFAKELNGIFNITFNDNRETVISKMRSREWWDIKEDGDECLVFSKENGTYGGEKVEFISFDFYNFFGIEEIFSISILFKDLDIIKFINNYKTMFNLEDSIYNIDKKSFVVELKDTITGKYTLFSLKDEKLFMTINQVCLKDILAIKEIYERNKLNEDF